MAVSPPPPSPPPQPAPPGGVVVVQRLAGKYEAIGFLLIMVGLVAACAVNNNPIPGALIAGVGFLVFLYSRFL